jgi:hypothetical protein
MNKSGAGWSGKCEDRPRAGRAVPLKIELFVAPRKTATMKRKQEGSNGSATGPQSRPATSEA